MRKINLSIFASGIGTNLNAIHNASKDKNFFGKIKLVICDNDCQAFHLSKSLNYKTVIIKKNTYDFDKIIEKHLKKNQIDLVCLAGFMTIISPNIVQKWKEKILNIHPSILPLYPGLDTHDKVLKSGMLFHGSTVHLVDKKLDSAKILGQFIFPIDKNERKDRLINKIKLNENYFYPKVINKYINTCFQKKNKLKKDIIRRGNIIFTF